MDTGPTWQPRRSSPPPRRRVVSISIPEGLWLRLQTARTATGRELNVSLVCQQAIERKLNRLGC